MHPYPAGCILAFNLKVSARGWIRETINPWGCGCTICSELFLQWTMYFKSWGKHRGQHSTPSFLGFHKRASKRIVPWHSLNGQSDCKKLVPEIHSFRVSQSSDSKPLNALKPLACWILLTWENQQTAGGKSADPGRCHHILGPNLTTRKRNLRSALLLWHMKIEQTFLCSNSAV